MRWSLTTSLRVLLALGFGGASPGAAAPAVLAYCGFAGGSGDDRANSIAVDGAGNAYLTGYTASSEATFPVTVGPDLSYNTNGDAFIAKVNPAGTGLV